MKRILAYGPMLKAELARYIRDRRLSADGSLPWEADFLDRLEPFAVSGKLLRGSVLCFAYEAFSGEAPDQAAVRAAMALELVHSALLIHDDIMDNDETRRGRPSMHEQYRIAAERLGLPESRRFGVNMALSGADAAIFMAMDLLSKSQAGARHGSATYRLFAEQLLKTCAGQMQDVYLDAMPSAPSKKEIQALMRGKTASYTLALPLGMGASLAGSPAGIIKRLRRIGVAGGTIFQIRDDELGIMGDPAKTGKPVGSDIKEGKKTLPYYYLLKKCPPADRDRLETIFGNATATDTDIDCVRKLMRQNGIEDLLGREVDRLSKTALSDIDGLDLDRRHKQDLQALINFCARRQS